MDIGWRGSATPLGAKLWFRGHGPRFWKGHPEVVGEWLVARWLGRRVHGGRAPPSIGTGTVACDIWFGGYAVFDCR